MRLKKVFCFAAVFGVASFSSIYSSPVKKQKDEEFVPPSKPDFQHLSTVPPSKIATYPEFIKGCKEMAGYYKDSERNKSLNKTIFISGINYSYRDFYHNFKCFLDKLGIKFFPISLDKEIYQYLTENKVKCNYPLHLPILLIIKDSVYVDSTFIPDA
jgi:hypothetical protein